MDDSSEQLLPPIDVAGTKVGLVIHIVGAWQDGRYYGSKDLPPAATQAVTLFPILMELGESKRSAA